MTAETTRTATAKARGMKIIQIPNGREIDPLCLEIPADTVISRKVDLWLYLMQQDIKRIIVAGHSLGANAAIAYAGSGHDIDGIIAIAPGHVPDVPRFRTGVAGSLKKARQMIAEGKSDSSASFLDPTRGTTRTITTTAAIYLSYFDPEGLAAMPKSAAAIPRPIPFLWIIGNQDPLLSLGDNYVFNKAPKHPRSSYLVVPGGHGDTPNVGAAPIIDWLASLGY